jgi:hypothetical protein
MTFTGEARVPRVLLGGKTQRVSVIYEMFFFHDGTVETMTGPAVAIIKWSAYDDRNAADSITYKIVRK